MGQEQQGRKLRRRKNRDGIQQSTTDVAWNVFIFDWTVDGFCRAAFRQYKNGAGSPSGRRDERDIFARAGCGVERGAVAGAEQGDCVLGGALWNVWELVCDVAGRNIWDGGVFANHRSWAPGTTVAGDGGDGWIHVGGFNDCRNVGAGAVGPPGESYSLRAGGVAQDRDGCARSLRIWFGFGGGAAEVFADDLTAVFADALAEALAFFG